ncbi:MAG: SDR family NAD(P)-dependent oxidoreductase [Chloroflexota bacterium]
MSKTILITGSTDGIGLETAKMLFGLGHTILLHGRNPAKLIKAENALAEMNKDGQINGRVYQYVADFSDMTAVATMAKVISETHEHLDVLINNAGIFKTSTHVTKDGLDVRFAVNTLAPYLLTKRLMPKMGSTSRVVNLSSAAQATVNLNALTGQIRIDDQMTAYAQSKLGITMWSKAMADSVGVQGPLIISVNPGSYLGTKMVKEGFGMAGKSVEIGVDILTRLALADEFASAAGRYFDNDSGQFAISHPDLQNPQKLEALVRSIEETIEKLL